MREAEGKILQINAIERKPDLLVLCLVVSREQAGPVEMPTEHWAIHPTKAQAQVVLLALLSGHVGNRR